MNVNFESRINEAAKLFNLLFANVPAKKFSYLWIKQGETKKTIPFDVSIPDNRFEMAKQAITYNDKGYDVYFGVCLMDKAPASNNRAKSTDITSQVAIWTDIDIESSAHKSGEKEKLAPDFNTAQGFLPFKASILVSSGYGLHGYNLLETPLVIDDSNRNAAKERNRKYLDVIRKNAGEYKIDGVADLARVLRVPGTYNYKLGRDNAPMCHIVETNELKYSLNEFDNLNFPQKKENDFLFDSRSKDYSDARTENVVINSSRQPHYENDPEYDKARVLEMLKFINPSVGYDDWILVGITLKAFGYSVDVWDEWSRPSEKYEPGKCEEKWQTFHKPDTISPAAMHALAKVGKYDEYSFKREYYKTHQAPSQGADSSSKKKYEYKKPTPICEEVENLKAELEKVKQEAPDNLTDEMIAKFLKSDFTDYDCAELFAKCFDEFRFNHDTQSWYKFDGIKWNEAKDDAHLHQKWIIIAKWASFQAKINYKQMTFEREKNLVFHPKSKLKEAKLIDGLAASKLNYRAIDRVMKMIKNFSRLSIYDNDLNSDKYLFNAQNFTIDLKTFDIRRQNPLDYCTMSANIALDENFLDWRLGPKSDAKRSLEELAQLIAKTKRCKEWDEFVKSAMPNPKIRALVQKYIGYSMSGLTSLKVFLFLYGGADTGKTTFIETVKNVLGDYAKTFPVEYILATKKELTGDEPSPILYHMRHCRLITASETIEGKKLASAKIKRFTGGDTLCPRTLNKENIEFIPQFKILMGGNFMPKVDNIYDSGLRTRLRIVPFNHTPKKKNTHLSEIFDKPENKTAIFNWIIEGAIAVMEDIKNGVNPFDIETLPEEMKKALERFYDGSDNIPAFIEDKEYTFGENKAVKVRDIWVEYLGWCKINDEPHLRRTEFEVNILTRYREKGVEIINRDDVKHKAKLFKGIGH